ncbi:RDD family protein [Streptomyces sp. NPDC052701]|uniref:RDD family protein n=1 Tax=Streptomyces sp. NPDC052701 TaxID=3155533 RepID=UPI003439BD44
MSAPTPAPGDDRPREGYYPDPSIPGYVRYWNGAAWVPGTSRPAPGEGEQLAPPPGVRPAGSSAAPVEETGPHFFDEDPAPAPGTRHGTRPEPASAWGADRTHQSGFGGDQDRRVSWGAPQGAQSADPRVTPAGGPARPDGEPARTDGTATSPPAASEAGGAAPGSTFVFRRPVPKPQAGTPEAGGGSGAAGPAGPGAPGAPGTGGPLADEGTMTFRALSPRPGRQGAAAGPRPGGADVPGGGPAAPAAGAQAGAGAPGAPGVPGVAGGPGAAGTPAGPSGPSGPGFGAGKAAAARAASAQAAAGAQAATAAPAAPSGPQHTPFSGPSQAAPAVPPQSAGPQPAASTAPAASIASPAPALASTPLTSGPGGGQSSWAQQVHRLAGAGGDEQPVAPWKPPVEDLFQAAARRQAAARPAGLGKRLAARLVDTLVVAGVTSAAAVPLGARAVDHVNEKIEAARLSGRTVTVWLLDGTTSVYLGIVLAVLLLVGVVYEVLPTARWGRTLGKKLLGLDVRDIEGHEAPGFGAALRRWLVYSVPGLLVVGVVGVLWCLFDKPWRQCWHDKAAHTFVAG